MQHTTSAIVIFIFFCFLSKFSAFSYFLNLVDFILFHRGILYIFLFFYLLHLFTHIHFIIYSFINFFISNCLNFLAYSSKGMTTVSSNCHAVQITKQFYRQTSQTDVTDERSGVFKFNAVTLSAHSYALELIMLSDVPDRVETMLT
jgi:hypothetical protein